MIKCTLSLGALYQYTKRLLELHFPDAAICASLTPQAIDAALQRLEYSFSHIKRPYYAVSGTATFDHLNSDHMVCFLYFLANGIWKESGDDDVPTRLFYLNKVMHGLDLFYSVAMPDIFLVVHPIGTILGKAKYNNYFVVYQNCTIGAVDTVYPTFDEGVVMYSRSTVLGDSRIGKDVVFAANSFVVDQPVPEKTVVVGQYPTHRMLPNRLTVRERCFEVRPT
jgi:serine O-acetyltransferase